MRPTNSYEIKKICIDMLDVLCAARIAATNKAIAKTQAAMDAGFSFLPESHWEAENDEYDIAVGREEGWEDIYWGRIII